MNERLPSEAELEHFSVSRSTVREALKRLAAQSLIRTQRGAFGGLSQWLSHQDARRKTSPHRLCRYQRTIFIDVACEARFALERSCVLLARAPQRRATVRHAP